MRKFLFILAPFFILEASAGSRCEDSFKSEDILFMELPEKIDGVSRYFEVLKEVLSSEDIYKRELAIKFFTALVEREQSSLRQGKISDLKKVEDLALTTFDLLISHLKKIEESEQLLVIREISNIALNHPSHLLSVKLVPEILNLISKKEAYLIDSFARVITPHVVKYPQVLAQSTIKNLLKIPTQNTEGQVKNKSFTSKIKSAVQLTVYKENTESLKESIKDKVWSYKRKKDLIVDSITRILMRLPKEEQEKMFKLLKQIHKDMSYPYVVRSMALKSYGEFALHRINPVPKEYY